MKTHFSVLLTATIVVLLLATAPVAGQSQSDGGEIGNATGSSTPTPEPEIPQGEQIDRNTRLLDKSYSHQTGKVTVVVYSESLQDLVISDAGAFQTGGVVEQRKLTVRPDQRVEITMPATRTDDGYVGVSIATREVLYAVPIEAPRDISPFDKVPPAAGWFGGATAMVVAVIGASVHVRRQEPDEPEVMD
jgi:hypothetical protein